MSRLIAILIRHADYNQLPDTPSAHQLFGLNDNGRKQAMEAVQSLKYLLETHNAVLNPVIDSSHLLRSWQTADIIMQGLNGIDKVETYPALAERGLGDAGNLTLQQIETAINEDPRHEALPEDWKSNSHYCLPFSGAESLLDAGVRVAMHIKESLHKLKQTDPVEDTLKIFVGHGAAFRHAAYHLEILKFEQIAKLSMFHAQPLAFSFEADGSWQHIAGEWKVRPLSNDSLD